MPLVAAKTLTDFLQDSSWGVIGLVVALGVAAWLIYRLRTWYGEDADRAEGDQELLAHLRDLKREGDVSEEEFRSIKGRLTERMEP